MLAIRLGRRALELLMPALEEDVNANLWSLMWRRRVAAALGIAVVTLSTLSTGSSPRLAGGSKTGVLNYRALVRRIWASLGVAVVTRAVAMARACIPKLQEDALQLLFAEGLDGEEATAREGGGDGIAYEDIRWRSWRARRRYCGEGVVV